MYAARGGGGGVGLLPGYVLDRSLLTDGEQDEILYALRDVYKRQVMERPLSCP